MGDIWEERFDTVRLRYAGLPYSGTGTVRWHPEDGAHIKLDVSPVERSLQQVDVAWAGVWEASPIRFSKERKALRCWLILDNGLPPVPTRTLRTQRLRILQGSSRTPGFHGTASFNVGEISFPNVVETVRRVDDIPYEQRFELLGIVETSQFGSLLGVQDQDGTLELRLHDSNAATTWSPHWRWMEAFRLALSIVSGREVQLLQRSLAWSSHTLTELVARKPVVKMSYFSPMLSSTQLVDATALRDVVALSDFLAIPSLKGSIIQSLWYQLCDAANAKLETSAALLLGIGIEAAVRTLYNQPTQQQRDGFTVPKYLDRLQADYFGDGWSEVFQRIKGIFGELRHRNAHPHWINSGKRSLEHARQELDDIIYLSAFYGKLILRLADSPTSSAMPVPHSQWRPLMTVRYG